MPGCRTRICAGARGRVGWVDRRHRVRGGFGEAVSGFGAGGFDVAGSAVGGLGRAGSGGRVRRGREYPLRGWRELVT